MNRRNHGRKSGVIVDACREHGVWFDAEELERILHWIREGGERRAAALEEAEQRASRHRETGGAAPGIPARVWQREETEWSSGSWLRELAELVLGGDWLRSLR
jgi:Zn-finger nucleic acid-binding protein